MKNEKVTYYSRKELEEYKKENFKKKLKKVCTVTAFVGLGFILGYKHCETRIANGLYKIFSNYPEVEKGMKEAIDDYMNKHNIK